MLIIKFLFSAINFWTSGSDVYNEGTWIWESTGARIYPGYANWATFEPNNNENSEDCIFILNGWYDYSCASTFDAICEAHPPDSPIVSTTLPPTLPPTTAYSASYMD
jgi:hypothetical protein